MRYASKEQKRKWLRPLMDGEIRSAFLMTEPGVASSDATLNIETRIEKDGDHYVINGRKWWSSGVGDPRCKVAILMGKTDPKAARHQQQSQILIPLDAAGIKVEKMLPVFGYDDAPHGHAQVLLENVRVPKENILLGEGRGFEIAQGRLGPGRIHHCMRTIGKAEEALEKMVKRLASRTAFGKKLIEHSIWEQRIAEARTDIEMNRLLCLKAADMMDKVGNKNTAQLEIAMIKVAAPNMALKIIDNAIQAFGGAGVSDEAGLARDYASMRTMRLADGPDEVHNRAIARLELRKYANATHERERPRMALPNNNGSVIVADSVRKDEAVSGTRPVEERHRIDEARLDGWLKENVEGYQGPLSVLQFKGGQSNPTYRLDTPGRSYVMRRRPFGKLLPSARTRSIANSGPSPR